MSHGIFSNINPAATSGNQLATILNLFKDGIASMLKAPTRDPNLQAGGIWLDDSQELTPNFKWYIKQWTGSLDILIATVDLTSNTVSIAGADSLFTLNKTSADSVGAILKFIKKRIAAGGQVLVNDILGEVDAQTTDNTGAQITTFKMKILSSDNTTPSQAGSYLVLEQMNTATASLTEKVRLIDGKIGIGISAPTATLHVRSITGAIVEIEQDSTTGAKLNLRKKRVTTNGQVLNNDIIAEYSASSTDQNGAETAKSLMVEVSATETHTDLAQGSRVKIKTVNAGAVVATDKITIQDDTVTIAGNLVVQGANTTLGTVVETLDNNIILNKSGNDASAEGGGVDITRTTINAAIRFDSALASKFKIGLVGTLWEVLVSGVAQSVSGIKTFLNDIVVKTLIQIDGATSGFVKITSPAAPTSWTLTLPPTDGNAGEILQTDGSGVTTWTTNSSGKTYKNKLINGSMQIDTDGLGTLISAPASGKYVLDQWRYISTQAGKFDFQRNKNAVTPPNGFLNYSGAQVAAAYTPLSTDFFSIDQLIEGHDVVDLSFGNAGAKSVSLSFWVYSSLTGAHSGSLRNGAGDRSYPFSFTINAANTWEYKTITAIGDTTGTWLVDYGIGFTVDFCLGAGSNFRSTAGTWQAGTFLGVTGGVDIVATASSTFYFTGVQLEIGNAATEFEVEPFNILLERCLRFYETSEAEDGAIGNLLLWSGMTTSTGVYYASIPFKVTKRSTPTITIFHLDALAFPAVASSLGDLNSRGFRINRTANATNIGGYYGDRWAASSRY
jgi:hypothetical protein